MTVCLLFKWQVQWDPHHRRLSLAEALGDVRRLQLEVLRNKIRKSLSTVTPMSMSRRWTPFVSATVNYLLQALVSNRIIPGETIQNVKQETKASEVEKLKL